MTATAKTSPKSLGPQFGVISWREGEDPFPLHLGVLKETIPSDSPPEAVDALNDYVEVAGIVHADMTTARAIAISLFGPEWKDFVMDVYDRLQTARGEEDPGGE